MKSKAKSTAISRIGIKVMFIFMIISVRTADSQVHESHDDSQDNQGSHEHMIKSEEPHDHLNEEDSLEELDEEAKLVQEFIDPKMNLLWQKIGHSNGEQNIEGLADNEIDGKWIKQIPDAEDNDANTTVSMQENNNVIKVNCTNLVLDAGDEGDETKNNTSSQVKIVDGSQLLRYLHPINSSLIQTNLTINRTKTMSSMSIPAKCSIVMFYFRWCHFSAKLAPRFNALGRLYPQFDVLAFDAYGHNSINMRYGLVGVPSILFFHNGKVVGKFNETDPSLNSMVSYIEELTGHSVDPKVAFVTQDDMEGPVKVDNDFRTDYLLVFCWVFLIICLVYLFYQSSIFKSIVETIRNNWREAEAQHEHID